jgi:hypothetical protein
LSVDGNVTAECESAICASWSVIVTNSGETEVVADWVAQLEVATGSSGFSVVDEEGGTSAFGPGESQVASRFCDSFPPNTRQYRVRFYIDASGYSCVIPAKFSPVREACEP